MLIYPLYKLIHNLIYKEETKQLKRIVCFNVRR